MRVSFLSATVLALANAKALVEQAPQWPYRDYTPKNFAAFKAGVQEALVQVMKQTAAAKTNYIPGTVSGRQLSEDFDIGQACAQYSNEQIGQLVAAGFSSDPTAASVDTTGIDFNKVGSCICSSSVDFNTLFATDTSGSDGIPAVFLQLCDGDCRELLNLIISAFSGAIASLVQPSPAPGQSSPDISNAFSALINCACAKPALLDALNSNDEPSIAVACDLCSNSDCSSAISLLSGDTGGTDNCAALPSGLCSTSSGSEAFTMVMTASGTTADFPPAVKTSMKEALAAEYNRNYGSSTGNIAASNIEITVTDVAARRLAESAGVTARRLSGTVNIAIKITLPAGLSAQFVGDQIVTSASARTVMQNTVNTALTTSGSGASVTGVSTEITVQQTADSGSDPCFPSSSLVTLVNGTARRLDALKEGDKIVAAAADGTLTTDEVTLLSIANPHHEKAAFFTLVTNGGKRLNVTAEHHLPVGPSCCSTLKKAKDVELGDVIYAVVDGAVVAHTVTKKFTSSNRGLHSPVLARGTYPVVDGVVTAFDGPYSVAAASYALPHLLGACKATGTCEMLKRVHSMVTKRDGKAEYI